MARGKKVPFRMCVGCREMKPKREMIRIVRTPERSIEIDTSGKKSGRGAYICLDQECLTLAVKRKSLEKALKCSISEEILEKLRNQIIKRD